MNRKNKGSKFQVFLNSRRAQVRGIDFALALLIFIVAFSQIIVVLTNLLLPSIVQMQTYSESQELDKVYNLIYSSTGNPTNWDTLGTSSLPDYKIGLQDTADSLSFSKINRLTNDIADYWKIDYSDVKASYSLLRDFAVGVDSPLTIRLENFDAGFGQVVIYGNVNNYKQDVYGADIWTFCIDENNNVASNYTTSKNLFSTINFISTLSVEVANYYTIVVFARVNNVFETYTVARIYKPDLSFDYRSTDFDFRPLVTATTNGQSAVDVTATRDAGSISASVTVVFPYSSTADIRFHNNTLIAESDINQGNIYYATNIPIPTEGLAVVIVHETDSVNYRAGYMGIPMLLNENEGTIFGSTEKIGTGGYIMDSKLLSVRNRLMRCQMWLW